MNNKLIEIECADLYQETKDSCKLPWKTTLFRNNNKQMELHSRLSILTYWSGDKSPGLSRKSCKNDFPKNLHETGL